MLSSTFIDELGYLSLDQQTSNLFYQVISTRHSQKRSTLITTNRLCGEPHKRFNAKSSFMLRVGIHRPICNQVEGFSLRITGAAFSNAIN